MWCKTQTFIFLFRFKGKYLYLELGLLEKGRTFLLNELVAVTEIAL